LFKSNAEICSRTSCLRGIRRRVRFTGLSQFGCSENRPGFSIIDILVSISVIAVLLAIMAPSLAGVRETTRKVVCASNIRQIGLGLAMFRDTYRDSYPDSEFAAKFGNANPQPQAMMTLRRVDFRNWDGLGHLYDKEFLNTTGVFYCPSHHGHYPKERFSDAWSSGIGGIVGNYHYRGPRTPPVPSGNATPLAALTNGGARGGDDFGGGALLADGMATRLDFNHNTGTNVLRADYSVHWYVDTNRSLFLSLSEQLVEDGMDGNIPRAWETLDDGIY
jgi:type II secretory pathway pseudopilin PulG